MKRTACEEYRRRLDRAEPDALLDPHADACPGCAVERRAARVLREISSRPARPEIPPSFAGRVAYFAAAEAAERAARAGRRRAGVSREFVWTIVAAVATACGLVAAPIVIGGLGSAARNLSAAAPRDLVGFAAAWLTFAGVLAADLTRRYQRAYGAGGRPASRSRAR